MAKTDGKKTVSGPVRTAAPRGYESPNPLSRVRECQNCGSKNLVPSTDMPRTLECLSCGSETSVSPLKDSLELHTFGEGGFERPVPVSTGLRPTHKRRPLSRPASVTRKADDDRPYKDWSVEQLGDFSTLPEGGDDESPEGLLTEFMDLDGAQNRITQVLDETSKAELGLEGPEGSEMVTGGPTVPEALQAAGFTVAPLRETGHSFSEVDYTPVWTAEGFHPPVPSDKFERNPRVFSEYSLYRIGPRALADVGTSPEDGLPPFVLRMGEIGTGLEFGIWVNPKGGHAEVGDLGAALTQTTPLPGVQGKLTPAQITVLRRASARKYFSRKRHADFLQDERENRLRKAFPGNHSNPKYPNTFIIPPIPMPQITKPEGFIPVGYAEHSETMYRLNFGYAREENADWYIPLDFDNTVCVSYGEEGSYKRHAIYGAGNGVTTFQKKVLLDFLKGMLNMDDWVDLEFGLGNYQRTVRIPAAIAFVETYVTVPEPVPLGLKQPEDGAEKTASLSIGADNSEGSASSSEEMELEANLVAALLQKYEGKVVARNSKGLMIEILRIAYKIRDGWTTKTEVYISEEPGYPDDRLLKVDVGAKSPVQLATSVVAELLGLEKDEVPVKESFYLQRGKPPKETPPNKVTQEEYEKAIQESRNRGEKVEGAQKREAYIKKIGPSKWRIYSEDDDNLGTFDSLGGAKKHLKEIHMFEHIPKEKRKSK